jgi:adenylosuccinate synthase
MKGRFEMGKDIITVDLGFGDQGKGTIVDFLARSKGIKSVLRYNGASQAVHNIVEPGGRHHACSQFCSGTFAGAKTHLSAFMLINPLDIEAEAEDLEKKGVKDPFSLITVDPRCIVITPFQKLSNRMREIARGKNRIGSCGKGVGETVRDARKGINIIMDDLSDPKVLRRKLDFLWRYKLDQMESYLPESPGKKFMFYFKLLSDKNYTDWLAGEYERFLLKNKLKFRRASASDSGTPIIYEGAQGVLLDEKYGFYPYITHSDTTDRNAGYLVGSRGSTTIGILRAYATRHGLGPFVTENKKLTRLLPDDHNKYNAWQDRFRVGWFDLVSSRYAVNVCKKIDALAITNLDRLMGIDPKIVIAYEYRGKKRINLEKYFEYERCENGRFRITAIRPIKHENGELAQILAQCRPLDLKTFKSREQATTSKKTQLSAEMEKFIEYIEKNLDIPVKIVSVGPTWKDKILRGEL